MMYAYNPRKKSPQQLERSLVGKDRWDFLNTILKELSLKKGECPKQHWMVVGPRGIGKSHLLSLLYYKITSDKKLRKLWIPVLFPEELRMARDLSSFLERALSEICLDLEKTEAPLATELRSRINGIRQIPVGERVDYLFSVFTWLHTSTGRFILLITENLQQLLGKRLRLIEQKKLRAYLQTEEAILLIGSATTVFDALHDHSHPFYHFFHISRLEDLSFDDLKSLIIDLLTEDNQQVLAKKVTSNEARIRALYSFTGGNPRIGVFLADMMKAELPDEMMAVMDRILDELTPYFEAILNEVPHYQEEILNTLAAYGPAQSPKEIAEHLESPQPTVRNYLKLLKENGYVRIAFTKGKFSYYCLKEYLYRIWYQMRDSSHREETRWMMELLLMLYSPSSIADEKRRLDQCVSATDTNVLYNTMISKAALFIEENPDYSRTIEMCIAAADVSNETLPQGIEFLEIFIKATKNLSMATELSANKKYGKSLEITFKDLIKAYVKIMKPTSSEEKELHSTVGKLIKNKEYIELSNTLCDLIIKFCAEMEKMGPLHYVAYVIWGFSLENLMRYDEAIEKFAKASEINPKSELSLWQWGDCLRKQHRYEEAIDKFKEAVKLKPDYSFAYKTWGDCLRDLRRYEEAEQKYRRAIEIDPKGEEVYMALGDNFRKQKRYDDAIKAFQHAKKINPKSKNSLKALAATLTESKEYNKAIRIYEGPLKNNKDCIDIFDYGKALFGLERFHDAAKQYQKLIDLNLHVAYLGYGCALEKTGKEEEALIAYLRYLQLGTSKSEIGFNHQEIFEKFIAPLIGELKPDVYLKQFYAKSKKKSFSRPVLATLLLVLGKYDVVNEHVADITTARNSKDEKEKQDIDLFVFTIKLCIRLKLFEGKISEVLRPLGLFIQHVKLLPSTNKKEKEVSGLILGLFKHQIHSKVEAGNIREILNTIRESGVPFNDVFMKVFTCISGPDSVDAQKYLNDMAIADIVTSLKEK